MLAFVDESGFPHPNDATSRPVLAAVCIPHDEMRIMIQRMYRIKLDVFGQTNVEVKAANMIVPRVLTRNTKNRSCVERIVQEIFGDILGLRVFAVVMQHPSAPPTVPPDRFLPHYRFLLQRVNGYSQQRGSKCVVAFDSQDEGNDQIVARRMKNFLFRSDEGRSMQGLLKTAFFVSSKVEEGIQLADLVAGTIRHHHEHPADRAFRKWVDTLYTQIRSRTMMVPAPNGAGDLYGIYFMPERYFYAQDSAS